MSDFTTDFKQFCRSRGADLVGIAPIERFDGVPPQNDPRMIFPDAANVVVIGRRITRGTLRGWEEGTNRTDYELFGYSWLDTEFTALTVFETTEYLEDHGWEACPIMCYPPEMPAQGIAVRPGQPGPNVNLDMQFAAVAAGLGEISYHGVFLSPRFGPRQRLQAIITDAPLTADPLCERSICGKCGVCEAVCPLGAIDSAHSCELNIAGKIMTVAAVDYEKCKRCRNGARNNIYHPSGKPDRLAALCTRSCLDMLERNGKIDDNFHLNFRQREPWAIGDTGENVAVGALPVGGGCADPAGFRKRDQEA